MKKRSKLNQVLMILIMRNLIVVLILNHQNNKIKSNNKYKNQYKDVVLN